MSAMHVNRHNGWQSARKRLDSADAEAGRSMAGVNRQNRVAVVVFDVSQSNAVELLEHGYKGSKED